MKKKFVVIDYILDLSAFCEKNNIPVEYLPHDRIKIFYDTDEELFLIGWKFGRQYERNMPRNED